MTGIVGLMAFMPLIVGAPWIIVLIWMLFCAFFLFMLHGVVAKRMRKKNDLINNGIKGIATIVNIVEHPEFKHQYNTTDNFATITFSIEVSGKSPFTLEKKERIKQFLYEKFIIGSIVPIRINRNDEKDVLFLINQIELPR